MSGRGYPVVQASPHGPSHVGTLDANKPAGTGLGQESPDPALRGRGRIRADDPTRWLKRSPARRCRQG